jgi:hypothetical protein
VNTRRNRSQLWLAVLPFLLAGGACASADDISGTVMNGTTRKPAAGDEVVLLSLSQSGMEEVARTQSDPRGRFHLPIAGGGSTYLVRVSHQGVTYHRPATPGDPMQVRVYEVSDKLSDISAIMDVQRLEATSDTLEVKQLVTLRNASQPPRTLVNDRAFEIQLAPEARLESGLVQVQDGQPLKYKPLPGEQKGHYYFPFPLRPGDTRFGVVYRLPYTGQAIIEPQVRNLGERFVVMLPRSMTFEPQAAGVFQPMPDVTPDNVQGTAPVSPGQMLAFRVSGNGMLAELQGRREPAQPDAKARPGGGLGPPIELPDPLHNQRWPILAGFAVLLAAGAKYIARPSLRRTSQPSLERKPGKPMRFRIRAHSRRRASA